MVRLTLLLLFLTACTPSATSTRSSAASDSVSDSASDSTAQSNAAQGMSHKTSEQSVPIIINCIQVYTNDPNVHVGPCIYRDGTKLPGDDVLK